MGKVLIVNSSARDKSNSSMLGAQVAAGAKIVGHEVETLEIGKLRINPCRGCLACMLPNSDYCVQQDDMSPLYAGIEAADVIIFASPIHWFNLGGQIKQFIDRCFAVAVSPDPASPSPFATKTLGAALAFGGDDAFDSGAVNAIRSLQDICQYTGAKWAGAIYGSAIDEGAFAADAKLLEKAREFGTGL
jgi:multimeric flavodoxin WrbA